jgi:hypothetical protein
VAKENIGVTVELEDALSVPAHRAAGAVDDLKDEVRQLNEQLAASQVELAAVRREMNALRSASGNASREVDKQSRAQKALAANNQKSSKSLKALKKDTDSAKKAMGLLGKIFTDTVKGMKISGILTLINLAAGGISALGAAGFAAIAGLSPLVGLLGAMPGTVIALISVMGVLKLGLKDVGAAVKAIGKGDAAKADDALAKLSVQGQRLALTLGHMSQEGGALWRFRRGIEKAVAPGLTRALRDMIPVLPVVQRGLERTAHTIGDLAESAASSMQSPLFQGQLSRVMATNTHVLGNGGRAAGYFASAMLAIADAFRPVLVDMSEYLLRAGKFINHTAQMGNESGRLTAFFKRSWALAKAFGQVLEDVAVALYNTGKQSGVMSRELGGGIADVTARWRRWTSSVEGQNAIRQWFQDAIPVVQAFGRMLGFVAKGLGDMSRRADLVPVIDAINTQLLPAISDLSSAVGGNLGPALVSVATSVVKVFTALAGSPLTEFLTVVAKALDLVASGFMKLPGPVRTAILSIGSLMVVMKLLNYSFKALKTNMLLQSVFTGFQAGMVKNEATTTMFSRSLSGLRGASMGAQMGMAGMTSVLSLGLGAALIGGTILLGKWMESQAKAKAHADELTSSLNQQTGAITANTRALVAKSLQDNGALDAAAKMGISLQDVTDAALGNEDAYKRVVVAMAEAQRAGRGSSGDRYKLLIGLGKEHSAVNQSVADQKQLAAATKVTWNQQRAARVEQQHNAGIVKAASKGELILAGNVRKAGDEYATATRKVQAHRRAVIALNHTFISQQRTLIGFRQALADADKTLVKGKKTLDLHTQAGRDNRSALLDVAEAAAAVENKAQRTEAIKEARARIEAWGKSAGWSADRAKDYADKLFNLTKQAKDVPSKVGPTVTAPGAQEALDMLIQVRNAASDIASQGNVSVRVAAPTSGRRTPRRDGGPVLAGAPYLVGEVGPELLLKANGAIDIIGKAGPENRTFSGDGFVLPHEFYEAMRDQRSAFAASAAPARRDTPAAGSALEDGPTPELHNHFHGDSSGLTTADVEQAAMRAYRRWERERKERR